MRLNASRAELYLRADNPDRYHQHAIEAGAKELSKLEPRDWGDTPPTALILTGMSLPLQNLYKRRT